MTDAQVSRDDRCPRCHEALGQGGGKWAFCPGCRFPLRPLDGRFRLLRLLAKGGVGRLYLAHDEELGGHAVVKVLHPEFFDEESVNIRFLREIRVTQMLSEQNPHIVRLYAHGKQPDLGSYYVMEWLQGSTLREFLRAGHPLRLSQLLGLFCQLCDGVHAAHGEGIVHRDLKPDNIYLLDAKEGALPFVKILDFGLAKALEGTAHASLTAGVIGTPSYMSPEQCADAEISYATDIYSLGVILYELCTRTRPFRVSAQGSQSKMLLIHKHMAEQPQSMGERRPDLEYPEGLDREVLKALSKSPRSRHPSVLALKEAIQPFADASLLVTRPPKKGPLEASPEIGAFEWAMGKTSPQPKPELREAEREGPSPIPGMSWSDLQRTPPTAESNVYPEQLTPTATTPPEKSRGGLWLWLLGLLALGSVAWWLQEAPVSSKDPGLGRPLPSAPAAPPPKPRDRVSRAATPEPRPNPKKSVAPKPLAPKPAAPKPVAPKPAAPKPAAPKPAAPGVRPKRSRWRRRLRRATRRSPKRRPRSRPRLAVGPCPGAAANGRWVFGRLLRPAGGQLKVAFLRCGGCRALRRSSGVCLWIPRSQGKLHLRIKAPSHQSCVHLLPNRVHRVQWSLKELKLNDFIDERYACATFKRP